MSPKPKALLTALFATLVALVALAAPAAAEAPAKGTGYVPIDKEVYAVPESQTEIKRLTSPVAQTLPSYYRSDEEPWAAGIRVKDQDITGLCWAFATTTASEYAHAKEAYETTGELYVTQEVSPAHLGQFFYHRIDDPLFNTSGDYNALPADEHWSLAGGNEFYGMQHMATWSGLTLEEKAPLEATLEHIKSGVLSYYDTWDGSVDPYSASLAYDDAYVLENSVYLSEVDRDTVKSVVYSLGAVTVGIEFDDDYMNEDEIDPATGEPYVWGRSFYNYKSKADIDHSVTIVGWDDSYPKENFSHTIAGKDDEIAYLYTTPKKDGAWICQNSWSDEYHDGGFFYVSYESVEFDEDHIEIFGFDMMDADAYAYNFQYDGTANCADSSDQNKNGTQQPYYTKAGTRAANVYTNTTGNVISIDAVGFTTYNLGTSPYDISVYVGLTDPNDPTSGTLASTTRTTTTVPGCKTAELDEAAIVHPGETFSIVFYFPETNAFGVETSYIDASWIFDAEILPGQSFFNASPNRDWVDMDGYDACFRIKAFANIVDEPLYEADSIVEIDGVWTKTDADGRPDYGFTGFAQNGYGWWYVENGIVTFAKTGFEQNEYGWWYIEKSYVSLTRTGLYQGGSDWWYVEGGRINFYKTAFVQNQYGWWLVVNGRVYFNYTGVVTAYGARWQIIGGKVVSRA